MGCSVNTVRLWKERFLGERLGGLYGRHQGRSRSQRKHSTRGKSAATGPTETGRWIAHWSTRKIAAEVGTNHVRVTRILAKAGLQPHRLRRYLSSNDPEFEEKAADIIGLYLKPPVNAAVFCVDEKSAIQALDRLDPVLPLSPGRAERHGFEYYRHGTLSLFAALNPKSGPMKESLAKTLYDWVRAEEFVPFSILFASGQRFEIKSREHIGLGPVSRSDVEGLKAVIVWDDVGKWRSVYMPAILKIERSQP